MMMSWIMERRFCAAEAASALLRLRSGSVQWCVNMLCSPNQTDSSGGVHERQIAVIAAMTAEAALTLPQGIYSSALRLCVALVHLGPVNCKSSISALPPLATHRTALAQPSCLFVNGAGMELAVITCGIFTSLHAWFKI